MTPTDGTNESRAIVGKMTFLSTVKTSRAMDICRIRIQVVENRFWGWRCQINDHLWGQCLDHLGRGGSRVVSVREGDYGNLD